MTQTKLFLKRWMPPILLEALLNLRGRRIRFEGDFSTWEDATKLSSGYDAESILHNVLKAALKVKNGEAAFERDSVIFDSIQYSWPLTAALMWAAARNGGVLNVLDFGGSLGSSYFQNRLFLASLNSLSWSIVEQPHFVRAGNLYISDGILCFYRSIEEALEINQPNIILLSSSIQYIPNPDNLLFLLNSIDSSVLVFDRTPFHSGVEHKLCLQNTPSTIYESSYPMWILSRKKVISELDRWMLFENFSSPDSRAKSQRGLEFEFSGMIFGRERV